MDGLAGKITSSLHESNFACYNCINGITSTADEYNFTSYNCIRNITICGRTVGEDYPSPKTYFGEHLELNLKLKLEHYGFRHSMLG